MLLAVDIGNTNITGAIFQSNKLKRQFDIPVKSYSKSLFSRKLKNTKKISATLISSVVPKLTRVLEGDLKTLTGKRPYIIGKDLIIPMKSSYNKPGQLGQDRLNASFAAANIYKTPLIVIDCGSAITFDIISKNKTHLGGLILPGLRASLKALEENTALLPAVKLNQPKSLIGRNTKDCILSGVILGTASSVKELVSRIKLQIGKDASVIGTGGDIYLIKKYSGIKIKVDHNLTLKGINFIYGNKN